MSILYTVYIFLSNNFNLFFRFRIVSIKQFDGAVCLTSVLIFFYATAPLRISLLFSKPCYLLRFSFILKKFL